MIQVPVETSGGTVIIGMSIVSQTRSGQLQRPFVIGDGADKGVGTARKQVKLGSLGNLPVSS